MCCLFHQATNEVIGRVPQSTKAEMDAAVSSCKRTFPAWADTSILSRQQVLLRYQQLIKENLVRKLNGIISQSVISVLVVTLFIEALSAALLNCTVQRDIDHGSLPPKIPDFYSFLAA